MNQKNLQLYFFLSLVVILLLVVGKMFLPFLSSLVIATTLAVVFEPLHQKFLKLTRDQKSVAALATILAILIIVFVPVTFLGIEVFGQAQNLYLKITESTASQNPLTRIENTIEQNLENFFPKINLSLNIDETVNAFFKWFTQNIGPIFSGLATVLTSFLLSLLALYYLLKDGSKLKDIIFKISPLSENHNEEIFKKLKVAIASVIQGTITVSIIQGILSGIGFIIFGVPNAALWGFITVIAALVPIVGTSLVLTPIIIYLFVFDTLFSAIGLLAWGIIIVGLIDNFLGPKLIQRHIQIHSFLILLSVLGGISVFGPIGFLIGPLFLALLSALLSIYPTLVPRKDNEKHHSLL